MTNPGTSILQIEGVTNDVNVVNNAYKDEDYFNYSYASNIYDRLIDAWKAISAETQRQRDLRYVKHNSATDLRASGILKADETYCPVRLIDSNIRAEQPSATAYITQSRRSIIFASPNEQTVDGLEKLEENFTKVARYLGWEIPFIQTEDGAAAHGWDAVEIMFDDKAPGNFIFEHIGNDCLIFGLDCEGIETQEVIAIQKNLTAKQLKTLVKTGGFNAEQVESIISLSKKNGLGNNTDDCTCIVYKCFFKKDDVVHYAWYGRNCSDYLRNPEPLFLGVRDISAGKQPVDVNSPLSGVDYPPVFESEFPVIIRPYIISNDPQITQISGRVKLDEASQEAASAIQSGLVNGILRAANIYAAPKSRSIDADPISNPKATDSVLANGTMYDAPLEFFHTPYPDSSVVQALGAVVQYNKQEQGGGIDLASINRKDSGKTATEIQAASQKSTELTSVQVILLSIFIRMCYAKAWRIYQNRVLQGAIVIRDTYLLNLFGEGIIPNMETGQVESVKSARNYIIKSSGDVDVIQRQERLNKLMQGWEVFGKTPIANEYLKDIIRYSFPEDAARYISVMEQAEMNEVNVLKQLLMKVSSVLMALIKNPGDIQGQITAHASELQQLQQQVMGVLGGGGGQQQPQLGNSQPQQQSMMAA